MKKHKKIWETAMILTAVCLILIIFANLLVIISSAGKIYKSDDIPETCCDAILVLGAGISSDGKPRKMLKDRLDTAFECYRKGLSDKIIVSGDHRYNDYDEVEAMKKYLLEKGVPSEKIYKDHYGLSTYDSAIRAKEVFGVSHVAVVTQKYHLYRAVFISESIGMNAIGVDAALQKYEKQPIYSFREIFARIKYVWLSVVTPEPQFKNDYIGLMVSGDITNEKND